jgi:hypothetical protein
MSTTDTRTYEELAADPQAFDTQLAQAYEAWEKASARRVSAENQIHALAGDRQDWGQTRFGRRQLWRRTMSEVIETANQLASAGERGMMNIDPARALESYHVAQVEQSQALLVIQEMEKVYARHGWQRFFPCTNRDGHIHSSYRGCSTVREDTPMAWRPDLSGTTVEQAIQMPPKGLGPALCSVCFPLAPVEQRSMTTGQVADELTKGEREAAKAARQAVKDAKQLTEAEQFRASNGDHVETVARCKELIRQAVEQAVQLEWYMNEAPKTWTGTMEQLHQVQRNVDHRLGQLVEDAGHAANILMARESNHEGHGATAADIEKMQTNKRKSARKEWGLA